MLIVYSKDSCPYCVRAKQYLKNGNIEFEEVDVYNNKEALLFLHEQGHKTVPQIYLNGILFVEGGCDGLLKMNHESIRNKIDEMDLSTLSL